MAGADRDKFQTAVAEQLAEVKRGKFRGDIALKLDLATLPISAPPPFPSTS